jgi:hypothetical protein
LRSLLDNSGHDLLETLFACNRAGARHFAGDPIGEHAAGPMRMFYPIGFRAIQTSKHGSPPAVLWHPPLSRGDGRTQEIESLRSRALVVGMGKSELWERTKSVDCKTTRDNLRVRQWSLPSPAAREKTA